MVGHRKFTLVIAVGNALAEQPLCLHVAPNDFLGIGVTGLYIHIVPHEDIGTAVVA